MNKKQIAYHEAGHAVAHVRLNVQQDRATIKPYDDNLGGVTAEDIHHVDNVEDARKQVLCYCAGYAALIAAGYGDQVASLGADDDFENAAELISWIEESDLDEWKSRSVALMSTPENIRAVEFVAKALMKHETLDGGYIDLLIDREDGDISEEEWYQVISWQYPGMT